jgi:hypothetical protein
MARSLLLFSGGWLILSGLLLESSQYNVCGREPAHVFTVIDVSVRTRKEEVLGAFAVFYLIQLSKMHCKYINHTPTLC